MKQSVLRFPSKRATAADKGVKGDKGEATVSPAESRTLNIAPTPTVSTGSRPRDAASSASETEMVARRT